MTCRSDKTCRQCRTLKPASEFYGGRNVCKPCYRRDVRENRMLKGHIYRENALARMRLAEQIGG